jgi:plastocyanin
VIGTLALASLAARVPAIAAAPPAQSAASGDPAVSIAAFAFTPAEISVPVGATLTWTNQQAGVPHTTTSADGGWDSGVLSPNDAFGVTFDRPGDFAYQCAIHPSMRGLVHVVAGGADLPPQVDRSAIADLPSPAPPPLLSAAPATSLPVPPAPALVPTVLPTVQPVQPAAPYRY